MALGDQFSPRSRPPIQEREFRTSWREVQSFESLGVIYSIMWQGVCLPAAGPGGELEEKGGGGGYIGSAVREGLGGRLGLNNSRGGAHC